MRFQCLEVTCGRRFGWTAKKIIKASEVETIEYVVCPYCGSLDFEEYIKGVPKKTTIGKPVPPVRMPTSATQAQFDPEDLMKHSWKGKKIAKGQWAAGSLAYGWDFKDRFKDATLDALEKGVVTVDKYEFKLDGNLVSTKES